MTQPHPVPDPIARLTAAATLLRALAAAAAADTGSSTWTARRAFPDDPGFTATILWADRAPVLRGGAKPNGAPPHVTAAVGDYIAALGPLAGERIAAIFDSAAVDARMVGTDPSPAALALADAILTGGDQ